ncbi:MAG: hypothetical protein ACD_39C00751G0001 [uncultured bacterium]|nr:MAG: hypothetical protein ACD_39C00751G0001 [uncultured bacterium]
MAMYLESFGAATFNHKSKEIPPWQCAPDRYSTCSIGQAPGRFKRRLAVVRRCRQVSHRYGPGGNRKAAVKIEKGKFNCGVFQYRNRRYRQFNRLTLIFLPFLDWNNRLKNKFLIMQHLLRLEFTAVFSESRCRTDNAYRHVRFTNLTW